MLFVCLFISSIVYLFIPVFTIKDIHFFSFLLSDEKNVQHIFNGNLNLLTTITGIFEKYSNKN